MANNRTRQGKARNIRSEALARQSEILEEQSHALRFEFVVSELDLAMTFCESAASTSDPNRSRRSIAKAEEAYSTAKHLLGGEDVSEPMRRTVQAKASKLESLLVPLRDRKSRGKSRGSRA